MSVRRSFMGLAAVFLAAALGGAGRGGESGPLSVGDAVLVAEPQAGFQRAPAVAALKAGEYLAVWQEGWAGLGGKCLIRGAVVKDGKPGAAFAISPAEGVREVPAVAFAAAGGKALVVWQELVGGKQFDVKAVLVSADGKPAGEPFAVAATPHNEGRPAVASDGKDFLVTWEAFTADQQNYAPFGARVSAEGHLLDGAPVKLAESGYLTTAAFNGQDYVVAFNKGLGLRARRVSRDGKLFDDGDNGTKLPGLMSIGPAVASDGREVMVAATGTPGPDPWGWGGPGSIVAARVLRDGTCPEQKLPVKPGRDAVADREIPYVLDATAWKGRKGWPQGAPGGFRGTQNGMWPTTPLAIAWTGKSYLVVWPRVHLAGGHVLSTNYDLYACLVSPDPVKALGEPSAVAEAKEAETRPALASAAAGECLLAYELIQPDGRAVVALRRLSVGQ